MIYFIHFCKLFALVFASVLLAGCVTETRGPSPMKPAPPEVQLQTLVDLGIGYIRNRDYARAKENLSRALEIDANAPQVHNAFGLVYQLEGENELADEHFRKATTNSSYTRAFNNYGAFLFAQGRYREAIEKLEVAAQDRFYANRPSVFDNLGVAYLRLGEPAKAEAAFLRATQLNPNQGRALLEMASIRYEQQNYLESRQYYRRHVANNSQSARSLWLCIRLSRIFNDTDGEASCALMLRNVFPASAEYKLFEATQ
jgi:type IV pilus assembly protein PilF